MAMIKPKFNGKDSVSGFYDGPPPIPGTYHGEVSRMGLAEVLSGDNKGADKIVVVVKITSGKFKGAEIFANFTLVTQAAWNFNNFLHALTDGSEKQKEMIKTWFWEKGYDVEDEAKNEKLGRQVNFIGKPSFKPIGKKISFVTEMNGEHAEIKKWVIPLEDSDDSAEDDSDLPDATTAVADDDDDDSQTETASAAKSSDDDDDEVVAVASDDDDDPWS